MTSTFRFAGFATVLGFAAALGACYPPTAAAPGAVSPAGVTWATAKWSDESEAKLDGGREIFVANCNRCHGYPAIAKIGDEKWPDLVKWMGGKANLDDAQKQSLLRFILATRHSS